MFNKIFLKFCTRWFSFINQYTSRGKGIEAETCAVVSDKSDALTDEDDPFKLNFCLTLHGEIQISLYTFQVYIHYILL